MKNANPSAENGRPKIAPEKAMNLGHSRPSSNASVVPETAPTAKRMPKAFDQRRASVSHEASCVLSHSPSATSLNRGIPTPSTAKTMGKPSDVPIVARASVTLSKSPCSGCYPARRLTRNRSYDTVDSARAHLRHRDRLQLAAELHLRAWWIGAPRRQSAG